MTFPYLINLKVLIIKNIKAFFLFISQQSSTFAAEFKNRIIMAWHSDAEHCKADYDNHSDQCNPNNDEYWHSRED